MIDNIRQIIFFAAAVLVIGFVGVAMLMDKVTVSAAIPYFLAVLALFAPSPLNSLSSHNTYPKEK